MHSTNLYMMNCHQSFVSTLKENFFYDKLLKNNNYDLIINCNQDNPISKKYFIKKINKDYNFEGYQVCRMLLD